MATLVEELIAERDDAQYRAKELRGFVRKATGNFSSHRIFRVKEYLMFEYLGIKKREAEKLSPVVEREFVAYAEAAAAVLENQVRTLSQRIESFQEMR